MSLWEYVGRVEESPEGLKSLNICILCCAMLTLCDPIDYNLPGSSVHGDSLEKNTGVGCHLLFQEIFPTQGLNPGLPHSGRLFTIRATREALNIYIKLSQVAQW